MTPQFWSKIRFNSLWKAAQLGSMLLLNLMVARVLQAGNSGNFLLLVTNLQLLALLVGLSIDSGIQYQSAAEPLLTQGLSRLIFRYSTLALVPVALLIALGIAAHWVHTTLPIPIFIACAALYVVGTLMFKLFSAVGFGLRSVEAPILLEGAGNFFLLLILLAGYFLQPQVGIAFFYQSYFLVPLVTALILYGHLTQRHASLFKQFRPPRVHFPSLFQYTGLAFLANIAFMLMYRMDYWWVAAYCSDHALGNYIQVSKLGQLFFYFPQLVATVIFPDVVQGSELASRKMIGKLMGYIALAYLAFLLVFLLFGRWGLGLVLGPTFDLVYPTFLLLVPGVFALGGLAILSTYFAGLNKLTVNLKGAVLGLVLMAIGDWIIIPRYQIAGAALVSSTAYIASFAYSYVCFRKFLSKRA